MVAERIGPSLQAVARQPYAVTLWTWAHLTLADRRENYLRRSYALEAAGLGASAYHDPKQLRSYSDALRTEMGLTPSREDVMASAEGIIDMVAQLDKIEGRT